MLHTIGHSNLSFERFVSNLQKHKIQFVADVRSNPHSRYCPHFSQQNLETGLITHGIRYVFMGNEFGARREEAGLLNREGKVCFSKVRETKEFVNGVQRIENGLAKGFNIAFLCSEGEPLECHRFSLVSVVFSLNGYEVTHILRNGEKENDSELLERGRLRFGAEILSIEQLARKCEEKIAFCPRKNI